MPIRLAVDYEQIKAEYIKGVPFSELARHYNIKGATLRAYGARNGWLDAAAKARQALQRSITSGMTEKGAKFAGRICDIVDKHISSLERRDPENLDLDDFEKLTRILERTNSTMRTTCEMDSEGGKMVLNMAVQVSPPSTTKPLGAIIDVEPENGAAH